MEKPVDPVGRALQGRLATGEPTRVQQVEMVAAAAAVAGCPMVQVRIWLSEERWPEGPVYPGVMEAPEALAVVQAHFTAVAAAVAIAAGLAECLS